MPVEFCMECPGCFHNAGMCLIRCVILRNGLRRKRVKVPVAEVALGNKVCNPFEQDIAVDDTNEE